MRMFFAAAIAVLAITTLMIPAGAHAQQGTWAPGTASPPADISGNKMTIEDPSDLDAVSVLQAQQSLHVAGFSPGPLNGIMGDKTRDALRAFQSARGLTVTGRLDPQTAQVLQSSSGIPQPSQHQ
jgi:peptidoglycan hydrolase-like protein with peptidoglycan-binding domain